MRWTERETLLETLHAFLKLAHGQAVSQKAPYQIPAEPPDIPVMQYLREESQSACTSSMGAGLWQAQMSAEADAFIGIPGGFGTLEELLEMVTWQQLGLHTKPVGIYNMAGYFDHLLDFFDHAAEEVILPWHPMPCCYWISL